MQRPKRCIVLVYVTLMNRLGVVISISAQNTLFSAARIRQCAFLFLEFSSVPRLKFDTLN